MYILIVNCRRIKYERNNEKKEIKEDKMFAIKENIEKTVRPLAEIRYKFAAEVNKITMDERGFGQVISKPELIVDGVSDLCEKIMLSSMSADDKLDILQRLDILVDIVNEGGYLSAAEETEWDELVRYNADLRIAEHTGRRGRNKK